ncbi:DUF3653 domain-containing protein [Stenotrophomonas geniculata]|uniref:DUF3653 domain-containing protein n=1 Tax=Stenotrophomonas geniculata TaxID=86188 RepID=UPI003AACAA09
MSRIDPHDRIDLTGPWPGFGFQAGHMFTPEGHQLEPCDMTLWFLTCNIAREWRLMMAEANPRAAATRNASTAAKSSVIYLAEALRIRRERSFGVRDPRPRRRDLQCGLHESWAETASARVKRFRRGAAPTPRQTGLTLCAHYGLHRRRFAAMPKASVLLEGAHKELQSV